MNRDSMPASNAVGTSTFVLSGYEETCDGKQRIGRESLESDTEEGVVVHPPGRTQKRWMNRRLAPGDTARSFEHAAGRKFDGKEDFRSRCESERGGAAESAHSDIRAA